MNYSSNKLTALAALGLLSSTMGSLEATETSSTCVALTADQAKGVRSQLDAAHQKAFNEMDCEGQNLVEQLVNQQCKGQNNCAGLNSCRAPAHSCSGPHGCPTAAHSCKGLGTCKGTAEGPFTNKNDAVDVAKKYMADKRMNAMSR